MRLLGSDPAQGRANARGLQSSTTCWWEHCAAGTQPTAVHSLTGQVAGWHTGRQVGNELRLCGERGRSPDAHTQCCCTCSQGGGSIPFHPIPSGPILSSDESMNAWLETINEWMNGGKLPSTLVV